MRCFSSSQYRAHFVFSETVIGIGVEEEDRKHTWMDDAESVSVSLTTEILG